jgi:hypothetical protein
MVAPAPASDSSVRGEAWEELGAYTYRGAYNCYIATPSVNPGDCEGCNCYINCYRPLQQVLQTSDPDAILLCPSLDGDMNGCVMIQRKLP